MFMLQVLVKWSSDPNFMAIYTEFLPEKRLFLVLKGQNPETIAIFCSIFYSLRWEFSDIQSVQVLLSLFTSTSVSHGAPV